MTSGLRWRILVLQVGLIGILAFVSGFLFWAANFTHQQVRDQLSTQQIYFPATTDSGFTALPQVNQDAMRPYAGAQMVDGNQAEVYANNYLGVHLAKMPTYAAASKAANANPSDTKAQATVNTVFRGVTLKGMLLQSYGWWTVGTYALYAGIGMAIASFAVLLALAFELYRWRLAVRAAKPAINPLTTPTPARG